jgi:hypothetical protein
MLLRFPARYADESPLGMGNDLNDLFLGVFGVFYMMSSERLTLPVPLFWLYFLLSGCWSLHQVLKFVLSFLLFLLDGF